MLAVRTAGVLLILALLTQLRYEADQLEAPKVEREKRAALDMAVLRRYVK